MITPAQRQNLASYYKIDEFTIAREYLQLLFLNYLYQHRQASQIFFKGGTAIHLLFNSPRFSEDLDFSTPFGAKEVKKVIKEVEKGLQKELADIKILFLYQGKNTIRFRLKFKATDFKYPFVIRIDFNLKEKHLKTVTNPLVTKFPLVFFPVIIHLEPEEILAEKIRAFLVRSKGRDLFDLWFLLEKGVKIDSSLVKKKLKEVERKFEKEKLIQKVQKFPLKNLELDLKPFLPQPQRGIIKILKERLIERLANQPH